MARIKSAVEIALERTQAVQSDKAGIELFETKQEGKKIANTFLTDPSGAPLEPAVKRFPKDKQAALRRGIFDILVSQITLPYVKEDIARLEAVGKGLAYVVSDRRFTQLYQQLLGAMNKYLEELEQYDAALRRQYAPKLRQKEEELARRTGRRIQLDPLQDPEFVAFYNQNMNALKDRYEQAISQVREQANALFDEGYNAGSWLYSV